MCWVKSCFWSVHPWPVIMAQTNDKVTTRSKLSAENRVSHAIPRQTMWENNWLQFFQRGYVCISKYWNCNSLRWLRGQKLRKFSKIGHCFNYFMKAISFLVSPGEPRHSKSTRVVIHSWVKNWAIVSLLSRDKFCVSNSVRTRWGVKAEWHIIIIVPKEKRSKKSYIENVSKIMDSKYPAHQLLNYKCQHEWELSQSKSLIARSDHNQRCNTDLYVGYGHSLWPE